MTRPAQAPAPAASPAGREAELERLCGDLLIRLGVANSYVRKFGPGSRVAITEDAWGDLLDANRRASLAARDALGLPRSAAPAPEALPVERPVLQVVPAGTPEPEPAPTLAGESLGQTLRRLRRERGERRHARCTQGEVARFVGVTSACVGFWETDRTAPSAEHRPRLAEFFGVPAATFERGGRSAGAGAD